MTVRWERVFLLTVVVLMAVIMFAPPVLAAPDSDQVSTAIESTWKTAVTQIKTITNNVIFSVVDCVLATLLFVKLAMACFDYKKYDEFDFAPVAILFSDLVFTVTTPTYVWNVPGV